MTAFGINLKKELDYQEFKLKDLSVRTGISIRTLENYVSENGPWPNSLNAALIADALGISMDRMFGIIQKSSGTSDADYRVYMEKLMKLPENDRKVVFAMIDLLFNKVF